MREVPLTGGWVSVVDDADYDLVARWRWHLQTVRGLKYARRNTIVDGRSRSIYIHRVLMRPPPGLVVDHIDGDGLNNSRANLRLVTRSQNVANHRRVGPHVGVSWSSRTGKWRATYGHLGARLEVGFFDSRDEAAFARDYVALHLRGDVGMLNSADRDWAAFDPRRLSPSARKAIGV